MPRDAGSRFPWCTPDIYRDCFNRFCESRFLSNLHLILCHSEQKNILFRFVTLSKTKWKSPKRNGPDLLIEQYFKFKNATTHKPQSRFALLNKAKVLAFVKKAIIKNMIVILNKVKCASLCSAGQKLKLL
jgi:hypothetical protein